MWALSSSILGVNLHGPHINFERLPIAALNDMAGSSPKIIINVFQIQQSYPKQFDYGVQGNIEHYGMETSPKYDLECLRDRLADVPILLVLGEMDPFTVEDNFERLMTVLPDEDSVYEGHTHGKRSIVEVVRVPDYNHADIILAKDADVTVNA